MISKSRLEEFNIYITWWIWEEDRMNLFNLQFQKPKQLFTKSFVNFLTTVWFLPKDEILYVFLISSPLFWPKLDLFTVLICLGSCASEST